MFVFAPDITINTVRNTAVNLRDDMESGRVDLAIGLAWLPHPVKLPEVAINVFWHAKVHRSPANQWLRSLVFDLFTDDSGGEPEPTA